MFPQLVEGGIEIESKFSYRKGKSSMPPTLSCGRSWSLPQTSAATTSRGVTFDGLKQRSAQIGTCVPAPAPSGEGPGPCLGTGRPSGGQASGGMRTNHQGAEGGKAGSQLQERSSGRVWKLPEANTGM